MDIGTILITIAVALGILDVILLLLGPRIREYENYSFFASLISFFTSAGAVFWMGYLIFSNQFQYEYVTLVTDINSSVMLKISGLWAGQSGSLVFWTFLSFTLYFGFRALTRGYEEDKLVYRAAIIVAAQSVLIAINALVARPFRLIEGTIPTDGQGLNPLLSTIWNVIHPPIIFIAYALILIPFSVKLAGFTMSSEERNTDPIPIVGAYVRFTTIFAWLMLSAGIAIGGYWAYIVLGWGGYWAWDPVETTSLIPWLLLTAYYHARPTLRNNDVIRDSFLVMAYITVLFATWTTRSGVLTSVHGFGLSVISWTMLLTLLSTLIIGVVLAFRAGFRDMEDDDESTGPGFFDTSNVRLFSIKIALIGLIIVAATSTIGVALPASYNLGIAIFDPANLADNMIGIDIEFFRIGFYAACVFFIGSAFYCMRTSFLTNRKRGFVVLAVFGIGIVIAVLSVFGGFGPLPTNYWPANFLIVPAVTAIGFLVIAFIRQMAGKDKIAGTRQVGRLMLHLGLIILLLGVFMSENVVYETNAGYLPNEMLEVGPNVFIQVGDVNLEYWNHERDFNMIVTINVIENTTQGYRIIGIGYTTVTGHPGWNMVSHSVYLDSTAFRDVFVAVTGFSQFAPGIYQVTIHTKILPLISLVWIGAFLMVSAMLPMFGIETQSILKAIRGKDEHLYEDDPPSYDEIATESQGN
ncbi:MAG: cytochrome c biogenesis protein CcsA [Candidatus Thorarchaeota archaeon]